MGAERRRARRARFVNGHLPPAAKIRPGQEVVLVNLSQSGALFESPFRFRPGHWCELQIGAPPVPLLVRARVERCFVARLDASSVRYRTAVSFEVRIPVTDSPDLLAEYQVPGDS
ncbi:MAG TPA: PilZ domain-containing protein [Vicinamibacterales bacterium]